MALAFVDPPVATEDRLVRFLFERQRELRRRDAGLVLMAKRSTAKKGASGEEQAPSPMEMWIGRARGIGAILGFAIAFWVCRRQGFDVADAALRGLVGAVGLSLVAWWSALLVIQALMRSAVVQTDREAEAAARRRPAPRRRCAPRPPPRRRPG